MRRSFKYFCALLALVVALTGLPVVGAAQTVTNDYFADAMEITSLPFSHSVNTYMMSGGSEWNEPYPGCAWSLYKSAWYRFSPSTDVRIRLDTEGSYYYERFVGVYRAYGSDITNLSQETCIYGNGSSEFLAQAGVTYYFQIVYPYYNDGTLALNVQELAPPANDNFADATPIGSLPFSVNTQIQYATREASEPVPNCNYSTEGGTIWHSYTPGVTGSISARLNNYEQIMAVYTGGSLNGLTQVACLGNGGTATFRAEAGTTYYFQLANRWGNGYAPFSLEVAPAPIAGIGYYQSDPSMFETMAFYNNSSDPAGAGFATCTWDFGDGTTATDCWANHKFAADGDYTVSLSATTADGRACSTSTVVPVRTHDVAITKFTAPQSASAGQTRQIVVSLNSKRYVETVNVILFRGTPWGFEQVGVLTQYVPVRSANRTTDFQFSYTFTPDDAAIGKVTFKAVASIVNARDALSADNEAISSPTKVAR